MPRYFKRITQDELKQKLIDKYGQDDWIDFHELVNGVADDMKVEFDMENYEVSPDEYHPLAGYHTLDNGLTFLGMYAGGDWEVPVFIIFYYSGSRIRGYIPKEGNTYNTITKKAYGNDHDKDLKDAKKRFPDCECIDGEDFPSNAKLIIEDIKKRIQEKK